MALRSTPITKKTGERPNSIGFDDGTLDKLLNILDKKSEGDVNAKRVYVRWPYRQGTVEVRLIEPMGSTRVIKMASRNISNGGLSLLHSAFLYPGSACEMDLLTSGGESILIRGTLSRCTHVSGVVHEIGIKFEEELDARKFVPVELLNDYFSLEAIDPEKVSGKVLHVDDSNMERKLVEALLADTGLAITKAAGFDEALEHACGDFDLLLIDYHLEEEHNGAELIEKLREAGVFAPVIALTGDASNATRDQLQKVGAVSVLSKPADKDTLLRAIAETLAYDGGNGRSAIISTLSPDDPASALARFFVDEAQSLAVQLTDALGASDSGRVVRVAREIASTAPTLGYQPLATMALEVTAAIGSGATLGDTESSVRALAFGCKRVRHRAA